MSQLTLPIAAHSDSSKLNIFSRILRERGALQNVAELCSEIEQEAYLDPKKNAEADIGTVTIKLAEASQLISEDRRLVDSLKRVVLPIVLERLKSEVADLEHTARSLHGRIAQLTTGLFIKEQVEEVLFVLKQPKSKEALNLQNRVTALIEQYPTMPLSCLQKLCAQHHVIERLKKDVRNQMTLRSFEDFFESFSKFKGNNTISKK